jgi:hypothetical protein
MIPFGFLRLVFCKLGGLCRSLFRTIELKSFHCFLIEFKVTTYCKVEMVQDKRVSTKMIIKNLKMVSFSKNIEINIFLMSWRTTKEVCFECFVNLN